MNIRSHRKEHLMSCHPEADTQYTSLFRMRKVKCHRSSLTRMLHKSILVRKGEGVLLNEKEEYSRTLTPSLRVENTRGPPKDIPTPSPELHKVSVGPPLPSDDQTPTRL